MLTWLDLQPPYSSEAPALTGKAAATGGAGGPEDEHSLAGTIAESCNY